MNDLKQWLKKALAVVGILAAVQVLALVLVNAGPLLLGEENCNGAALACPKEHGFSWEEVEHAETIEELGQYYGWDYLIMGCGWSSLVNQAVGCQFAELESNRILPAKEYNFISWGSQMQSGRLMDYVPLIRFSFGDTYGEVVLPCSGYTCEYGNLGCAGCYDCGIQGMMSEE